MQHSTASTIDRLSAEGATGMPMAASASCIDGSLPEAPKLRLCGVIEPGAISTFTIR
jgi:hypothetical protein